MTTVALIAITGAFLFSSLAVVNTFLKRATAGNSKTTLGPLARREAPNPPQRREFVRIPVWGQTSLRQQGSDPFEAVLANVSGGGAKLYSPKPLRDGEILALFTIDGQRFDHMPARVLASETLCNGEWLSRLVWRIENHRREHLIKVLTELARKNRRYK